MKLRFRNNTLRFRVNRREVNALASGERLEEAVVFPGNARLSYAFESHRNAQPGAAFQHGAIQITAPLSQVEQWAQGDSIGLYFDLPADDTTLKVALEKDLECVDGPAEEMDPEAFARATPKSC